MSNISLTDGHIDNAEHCVSCGAVIPEGRQVCIICGLKTNYKQSTADDGFKNMLEFWDYDIGKTVFLTREEAEKALERSKGNA